MVSADNFRNTQRASWSVAALLLFCLVQNNKQDNKKKLKYNTIVTATQWKENAVISNYSKAKGNGRKAAEWKATIYIVWHSVAKYTQAIWWEKLCFVDHFLFGTNAPKISLDSVNKYIVKITSSTTTDNVYYFQVSNLYASYILLMIMAMVLNMLVLRINAKVIVNGIFTSDDLNFIKFEIETDR